MIQTFERTRLLSGCLLLTLVAGLGSGARAEAPAWQLKGTLSDKAGNRLSGNFLIHFRVTGCTEDVDELWGISKYVKVSNGNYTVDLNAKDFLPEGTTLPRTCRISAKTPHGAPWSLSPVRIEKQASRSKKHKLELERELERLRVGLAEDRQDDALRDSVGAPPERKQKAQKLKKILADESKLLERRLDRELK